MNIQEIEAILKTKQNDHRYRHTIGVQYTAICLAMRYGEDQYKASLAGLLHDCAKHLSNDALLNHCICNDLPVSDSEKRCPFLLHGKVGAWKAAYIYQIKDEDILNAIRFHTTGRPNMSLLEKIVFVADYIEPGRNQVTNLDEIRQLSFIDLDQAVCVILKQTLDYLKQGNGEIDPTTEMTYRFYQNLLLEAQNNE